MSHHHKILDYLESYHGGTGRTRGARTLCDGKSLIFPTRSGKPILMSTLRKMLRHHRIAAVAHGFRSSLRDWAAEETDHPREVIETALAHVGPTQQGEGSLCVVGPVRTPVSAMADWAATSPAVSSARHSMALRPRRDRAGDTHQGRWALEWVADLAVRSGVAGRRERRKCGGGRTAPAIVKLFARVRRLTLLHARKKVPKSTVAAPSPPRRPSSTNSSTMTAVGHSTPEAEVNL